MRTRACALLLAAALGAAPAVAAGRDFGACLQLLRSGLRPVAGERDERGGKEQELAARCRGGRRTVAGTLLDLEYQRIELIKFNLFDNAGTYREYVTGRDGLAGPAIRVWPELRLPPGHPRYADVGGAGPQLCRGDLLRHRQLTGICNDLRNPLMGSTRMPFARNVQFESTFPELGWSELARNRHGGRLGPLTPDPQVISRRLFSRRQSAPELCNEGRGLPGGSPAARCDYQPAPHMNVLAAFWIQFMTHDWFSHLDEGRNGPRLVPTGCASQKVDGVERALTAEEARRLGCRPDDRIDGGFVTDDGPPPAFAHGGEERAARAYRTAPNLNTAWWDASQLYGYDEVSRRRVKRDPRDPAKLLLVPAGERRGGGEAQGYLPLLAPGDPMNPQWAGQEAAAFADNWTVGVSFFHNVFAREHNLFVEEFRRRAAAAPDADSGLRDPARPAAVVRYRDVTADELFEAARLTVAAEIAKIHTIEWTTQLLYDEPLYRAMNANWSGLFGGDPAVRLALQRVVAALGRSRDGRRATAWYSVLASGPGIVGIGSHDYRWTLRGRRDAWSLADPDHVNGGVNHFGSPFNFPEEFVSVYRLHPMVPDLLEYRELDGDPNAVVAKRPVVEAFRGEATRAMREGGLANWALSLGRQRLGRLSLANHPLFLQGLELPRLATPTGRIDVAALDVLRDRERGVPRFNELRRQLGLRQLTGFDDFVDRSLPAGSPERVEQERLAGVLREVYGRHRCTAGKPITEAQRNPDGSPIDDCLGRPDGTLVDNVEDLDTVVGWLAEPLRPQGFAISETQFQVFILNASRRLFSDRFFTSSFRPELYSHLGIEWVTDNGPRGKVMEAGRPNGHRAEVSPLKRVLLRTLPELGPELAPVVNAFDPWARDRGERYSLAWTPRPGAESDPAFRD